MKLKTLGLYTVALIKSHYWPLQSALDFVLRSRKPRRADGHGSGFSFVRSRQRTFRGPLIVSLSMLQCIMGVVLCIPLAMAGGTESKKAARSTSSSQPNYWKRQLDSPVAYRHEVSFGGIGIQSGSTGSQATFNDGTSIGLTTTYSYTILPNVQVGGSVGLLYVSLGTSNATAFSLLTGPTVNFPFDRPLGEAFYGTFQVGVVDTATTDFAFSLEGGKRFQIFEHVTYRPSAGFYKTDNSSLIFVFRPLLISLIF